MREPDGVALQINVSAGGVPKRPIPEAVVTAEGLAGDSWRHPQFHGGPKRAVLLITAEGVDEVIALGFPLFYGALGENITARGLDRRMLRLGQRLQIGEIEIELRELRIPCSTLDVYGAGIQTAIYDRRTQAGDVSSPRWGLSGFYASVVTAGTVRIGDRIAIVGPASLG
jgi:MOSC domain-containing protein YiiM